MASDDRDKVDEITAEGAFVGIYDAMGGGKMSDDLRVLVHNSMLYAYHNNASPQSNYDTVVAECTKEIGPH
ncbi:MAG: hypothetical protein ABSC63_04660 [Candidatus Binataceae bacterium]|jgi:hypothetical protein